MASAVSKRIRSETTQVDAARKIRDEEAEREEQRRVSAKRRRESVRRWLEENDIAAEEHDLDDHEEHLKLSDIKHLFGSLNVDFDELSSINSEDEEVLADLLGEDLAEFQETREAVDAHLRAHNLTTKDVLDQA